MFLVFLMYINDLPENCSPLHPKRIMLLADDTKTYECIGTTPEQHQTSQETLQARINSIAEWADTWKLMLHPDKAKILHIGKNNPCMNYTLKDAPIKTVTEEKDIGFWITDTLSTTTHIQKARAKALAEIHRIRRNFSYIDKQTFCILYNQRVRPHLDYGMTACPPGSCVDSKLLESVQDKATGMVNGLRSMNAEERRKMLGLMTLKQRRERGDLIEVYKILNGLTKINPEEFWEVREARNGARLVKELAKNGRKPRQNFFSYRVIQKWNLLPEKVKNAPSLDCFKSRLDKHMSEKPST